MSELAPIPERFKETRGRQLDLPSIPERFSLLERGRDFVIRERNKNVRCAEKLDKFIVFAQPVGGTEEKTVHPPHWRSITTPGIKSELLDKNGEVIDVFYEVNTKGAGFVKPRAEGINLNDYQSWTVTDTYDGLPVQDLGMADLGDFKATGSIKEMSDYLARKGVRTEVYWAVAKLKRIPFKEEKVPIRRLVERGVIDQSSNPYIGVRLFKTNDRITEAVDAPDKRTRKVWLDAFAVFNREAEDKGYDFPKLDINNSEHQQIFIEQFFRRMGKNIGLLIDLRWSHGGLHSANISMAAELTDIATVGSIVDLDEKDSPEEAKQYAGVPRGHIKDMRDVATSLKKLLKGAKNNNINSGARENLRKMFFAGFDEVFDPKEVSRENNVDANNARRWMEEIFNITVIDRCNLPSLHKKRDPGNTIIEDRWGIDYDSWL